MRPDDERHGTTNGYTNLRCRCLRCREAWRLWRVDYRRRKGVRPASVVNAERRTAALSRDSHGTEHRYNNLGCRCDQCKAASAAARRKRRANNPEIRERENAKRRERYRVTGR